MAHVRVIVEFADSPEASPTMRWERTALTDHAGAFQLLGRAFEVTQRDANTPFAEALIAFLQGALIQRGDLADILNRLDDCPKRS